MKTVNYRGRALGSNHACRRDHDAFFPTEFAFPFWDHCANLLAALPFQGRLSDLSFRLDAEKPVHVT